MAKNPHSSEKEIFKKNYARFCDVLEHEDNLLPYLVENNIISWDILDEIKSESAAEKGPTLLRYVSSRLEIDQTHEFYGLLDIMINYGKMDAQEFARKIKQECLSSSNATGSIQDGIEYIKSMVGDQFTEQDMVEALQCSDIDAEAALDYLLKKEFSEPQKFEVFQESFTSSTVTLSWEPPNPPNGSIMGYIIQYNDKTVQVYSNDTTSKISGLTAGIEYEFKVAAVYETGPGPFAKVVSLVKGLVTDNELDDMIKIQQFEDIKQEKAKSMLDETKVLFITANPTEHKAVIKFFKPRESTKWLLKCAYKFSIGFLKRTAHYTFGKFGKYNAAVQIMGAQGPAAAQSIIITTAMCFKNLEAIFAVGVACGVECKTKMLDVIVAKKVTFYSDARFSTTAYGRPKIESRSISNLNTSKQFCSMFQQMPKWSTENSSIIKRLTVQPEMHLGNVLSENYLVDNKDIKICLLENFAPDAIAIEMESAGLFYEYGDHNVEIMLVKAVSDFGDGHKSKEYQPTAALLAAECVHHYLSGEGKIKPEYFAYNAKDIKDSVSEVIKKFNTEKFVLPEDNAQEDCDKVQLLLMTVNDNEFHAALHHMAKRHIKNRNLEDSDIPKSFMVGNENEIYYFYIGNFADIPTALVKHKQGSSESQKLAGVAMKIFLNLKAIVAVGVCGTFGEFGHVIVSSEIVIYQHDDKDKSIQSSSQVLFNFLQAPGNWEFNCYNDSSQDKYLSQSYFKPFLCPSTPEAYHKFEDKIREDVCEDAMGIEMEGSGIIKAKGDDVHFIIVKSGCKYANGKVTEAWEPVAAMAATSFVYFKFSSPHPQKWFKDQRLSTTLSSAADTTRTVPLTSTSIAEDELLDIKRILELQKEVFTNCRQHIVQYLNPDDIVDHLISKHLIGDSARQELILDKITMEKNRIIVDELCSGGPDTFKKFCGILKENSRTKHIADRLEKEWRRLLESSQINSEQLQYSMPVHTKITKEKNLVQPDQLEVWAHKNPFDWISPTDKDTKLMQENTQILLVTANKHEYNAVLTLLEPIKNSKLLKYKHCYNIGPLRKTATYIFGKFGAFNAAVHRMESQGPPAAQDVITVAASCFGHDLNAIIAVGVACGVDKRNDYLDVLVSDKITFYQYARCGTSDKDKLKITNRDIANLPISSFLRDLFKQPPQWPTNENGGTVAKLAKKPVLRLGTILSGNKLVDNKKFKEELLEKFSPEAIGIEMEGAGLYHNYNDHNYEILVVKGVCDFGDGKKDKKYQPTAALLAAECVQHYLSDDHLPQLLRIHCRNEHSKSSTDDTYEQQPLTKRQKLGSTEHSKSSTDDTSEQQPLTKRQKLESTGKTQPQSEELSTSATQAES